MGDLNAIAARRDKAAMAEYPRRVQLAAGVDLPVRGTTRRSSRRSKPSSPASPATWPTRRPKDLESQVWKMVALAAGPGAAVHAPADVNLVNINISRIMERASEIGVRKAFGAPSRTLVGQFLVENVLLTLIGGPHRLRAVGLRAAWIERSGGSPTRSFTINLRVFAYGVALAVVFGLISGVYPAWRMSRLQSGAGAEGRPPMTRHLLKLIWNRKRQNFLLTVEIFFSFLVLFAGSRWRRTTATTGASRWVTRSIATWSMERRSQGSDEDPEVKARHRADLRTGADGASQVPQVEVGRRGVHGRPMPTRTGVELTPRRWPATSITASTT